MRGFPGDERVSSGFFLEEQSIKHLKHSPIRQNMPAELTQALMRGGGEAANNRRLTGAMKLSRGRKALKWPPGEYAYMRSLKAVCQSSPPPAAFNCEGGLAHTVTPPQPITGDGQHLFASESRGK